MQVREYHDVDRQRFRAEIMPAAQPAILRGLARDWPAVKAATTTEGIAAYLKGHDAGTPIDMLVGEPESRGRFFYNADMTGFNFTRETATISGVIEALLAARAQPLPCPLAAQAINAEAAAPAFARENSIDLIGRDVTPRLWIGNDVTVAAHHDMFSNIAVVVAGQRRFTLFPPEQVANLHIGPFEFTPAGTPVSLVDFGAPDLARFPRFEAAWATRQVADLMPGDAVYVPYLWWHHVQSQGEISMLANYWWNDAEAAQPGLAPVDAMVHAFLAFSGLPDEQRAAWAPMFAHLVFGQDSADALPAARAGIRGRLTPEIKQRIRRQLGALMAR